MVRGLLPWFTNSRNIKPITSNKNVKKGRQALRTLMSAAYHFRWQKKIKGLNAEGGIEPKFFSTHRRIADGNIEEARSITDYAKFVMPKRRKRY